MPVMNYKLADQIMDFASREGIKVRGHVLVWDAYMSDWFFREKYLPDGDYVDRETLLKRLDYYITEVITHFEKKYPGVVYCWDVVNEAVADNKGEYDAKDPKHIRKLRNNAPNQFEAIIGNDYVEQAFLMAKNATEALKADIDLYYNDYNAFQTEKSAAIGELVKSINSYAKDKSGKPRKLCDGVGMQGYIGGYGTQDGCMQQKDLDLIEKAIRKYGALGVKIQFTEMSIRNFKGDEESQNKHAQAFQHSGIDVATCLSETRYYFQEKFLSANIILFKT